MAKRYGINPNTVAKWKKRQIKFLRTHLGQLIRDIRRQIDGDGNCGKSSPSRLAAPRKSAASSNANAAGNYIPGTPRRPSASEKERPARLANSVSRSRSPTHAARAASLSSIPRPCPATPGRVFKSGQKRGVHCQIKKELRRGATIEPVIGHFRTDGHLGRKFAKGRVGDQIDAAILRAINLFSTLKPAS